MKQYVLEVSDAGIPIIKGEILPAPVPVPVPVPSPSYLLPSRGMNLAGGDSDWTKWGSLGPVYGTNYLFVSTQEIDNLLITGANTFRLLFTWEALQSSPYATLEGQVGNYKAYGDRLDATIKYITGKGGKVLLDIHGGRDAGFAAYHDVRVGGLYNGNDVGDMLENLWWQLATKYKTNTQVMYGITNEPHDISATVWYEVCQKVINGIRRAGATTRIYAPGIDWTGAGSWMAHNAAAFNLVDPLANLGVQVHLYFDQYQGGGGTDVVSSNVGVDRCRDVTTWARSRGIKLFLAEVGLAASNSLAKSAWANLHTFLLVNKDVWDGFTFWAAGPVAWWSGYQFYCGPGSAQLAMIQGTLK